MRSSLFPCTYPSSQNILSILQVFEQSLCSCSWQFPHLRLSAAQGEGWKALAKESTLTWAREKDRGGHGRTVVDWTHLLSDMRCMYGTHSTGPKSSCSFLFPHIFYCGGAKTVSMVLSHVGLKANSNKNLWFSPPFSPDRKYPHGFFFLSFQVLGFRVHHPFRGPLTHLCDL